MKTDLDVGVERRRREEEEEEEEEERGDFARSTMQKEGKGREKGAACPEKKVITQSWRIAVLHKSQLVAFGKRDLA